MLELKGITKIYPAGGDNVQALRGVDLRFRENEFVSILGQSGCGKTTMLNIIGGLDHYTDGDLFINGVSTKQFNDRDWDAYRNHSVGFVFQSYNLIPHQTVLQNVELALTLAGVSKAERRRRAKEALDKVGLSTQLRKKPTEMSGGQMQRVAIARAIVNDPDIVLADEPTGALDTETSVQVMEILKEIAKDRLVIMVTHNPELAEQYSTRIVRMLDGKIVSDTAPLAAEEAVVAQPITENAKKEKKKKPSMSLATSFGLSLKNLFTKKGRTILTSVAGSFGILGIALIYAVSQGTTNYIDSVQEETLASYPLTIEAQHIDLSTLLTTFAGKAKSTSEHENDAIYQKAMVYEMMNAFNSLEEQQNDLRSFKAYIEKQRADKDSDLGKALSGVKYTYDLDMLIYTQNVDGKIIRSDTQELMSKLMADYMGMDLSGMTGSFSSSMMTESGALWKELLSGDGEDLVSSVTEKQYQLVYGSWPTAYDEIVLFVDENNELDDMTLYALGLKSEEEIEALMKAAVNKEVVEYDVQKWSYKEICSRDFRTVLASDCYTLDAKTGVYTDLRDTEAGMKYLYDNALTLRVTGIVRPNEGAVASSSSSAIGYTRALTEYVINKANDAEVVQAQMDNPNTDVLTGLAFRDDGDMTEAEKAAAFRKHVNKLGDEDKAQLYRDMMSLPAEEDVQAYVNQTLAAMTRSDMENLITQSMGEQTGMSADNIAAYLSARSDEELRKLFSDVLKEKYKEQYAAGVQKQLATMSAAQLTAVLEAKMDSLDDATAATYYDEVLTFSDSTYEDNLIQLGRADLDTPASIHLYATSFENKDLIESAIEKYNESVDDLKEIQYTDYVGIIMSSVTTIIDAITYVLIAFVSVSLIVSAIMIGVITLISVQERTKEIGILRAIGASRFNVSSMFTAETVIIGFISGMFGVLTTYLLCIPINLILHRVTGLPTLSATLPIGVAVILVLISMFLTLVSGIIPSFSAAKKDPVEALRTE